MRNLVFTKTEGDLSISSFLSRLATRDASGPMNPLAGIACEEHDLSEPLTKVIYNILRGAFDFKQSTNGEDFNISIEAAANDLRLVYLNAILEYQYRDDHSSFNFADFARVMSKNALISTKTKYLSSIINKACPEHGIDLGNKSWQFPKCNPSSEYSNDEEKDLGPSFCKSSLIKKNLYQI